MHTNAGAGGRKGDEGIRAKVHNYCNYGGGGQADLLLGH